MGWFKECADRDDLCKHESIPGRFYVKVDTMVLWPNFTLGV